MIDSVEAWLPLVNFVFGLVGFTWFWLRTGHRRHEYPAEVMMNFRLTLALFFALLCTSAEMIVAGRVPLLSAGVITVAKVYALIVLWRTSTTKYRTGTRTSSGNHGDNADENI